MKRKVITTAAIAGILLLLLAVMPASAVDKVEIRGEVYDEETGHTPNATGNGSIGHVSWNAYNFAGFWYDLEEGNMSEELVILDNTTLTDADREIPEDKLYYTSTVQYIEYEVSEEKNLTVENGLDLGGTKNGVKGSYITGKPTATVNGGGYYGKIGWFAEEYVAL
ncbi:hypothetical protein B6U67_04310, partial [Methanosarcinales archaeon ex4484_138]